MTQDELRTALLDALYEYETLKKKRRLRAIQKALRGTVMATFIGSAGLTAAANGENSPPSKQTISAMVSNMGAMSVKVHPMQGQGRYLVKGAAHFAFNQHELTAEHKLRLMILVEQLPKDAELTVIGRTDAVGVQQYNKKLGRQRANAVADFLANNGVKVKSINSMPAKHKQVGWKQRRVDIMVSSASTSLAMTMPTHSDRQVAQQPQAEPKPSITANDYRNTLLKTLDEHEAMPKSGKAKHDHKKPALSDAVAKFNTDQLGKERQKVTGVAHFAANQHTLTSAHKDRLIGLVQQLPKDAELTVIGRTDPSGGDEHYQDLGLQRAKTVAIFLANQGVTVKAVGSRVSSKKFSGWAARRVDIVVDSEKAQLPITLPLPVSRGNVEPFVGQPENSSKYLESIKAIKPARLKVIERNATNLLENARYQFNTSHGQ